jgi:glutaredoxin
MKYAFAKKSFFLLSILSITCLSQAQMYKWVGPDGRVTYSDQPPPANIKKVETKSLTGRTIATKFPAELEKAVNTSPAVLYTTLSCAPCDQARSFLKQRGIPFAEKTITSNEDIEKLKKETGGSQLPTLLLGTKKFLGLTTDEWQAGLTAATYPETNKLPKDYRYPTPESLTPAKIANEKKANEVKQELPKPKESSVNGIRF